MGARGTPDSPLVMILEAPGTEELKLGAPVCGPSGDLLDKCTPGEFDFDSAFVINAMQCRPPKTNDAVKDKDFKAKACAACRERVLSQVFMHPRKAILAMGAWSNTVLTNDYSFKITQRRGRTYAISHPDTGEIITVVPAVHPAFLLRGSGNPGEFRKDVALAIDLAFNSTQSVRFHRWTEPQYTVLDTPYGLHCFEQELQKRIDSQGEIEVTCDLETSGFNYLVDVILCIGFYFPDDRDSAWIVPNSSLQDPYFVYCLRVLLHKTGVRFIWQNGKFDEQFLVAEELVWDDETLIHEDTLLLSYALSEATKDHDLDEQAKNDLGIPEHKDMLRRWVSKKTDSYANVPEPVLYEYTAKDLKKTHLVYEHKRPLVAADPHLEKLYTRTLIPASHLCAQIETYGIHVDWDYVRINRHGATPEDEAKGLVPNWKLEIGLENELVKIAEELEQVAGFKVNPNSPDEVAFLLYDTLELRIKNKRPTDTRKETLEKIPSDPVTGKQHPAVRLIRKYRSVTKMLSTYVGAIEKMAINDRIHTTFKLHATTTGRLSSSEPNIQNIPRNATYRRMYRARPGMKLMEADYNTAELRMLAVLSRDVFLTEVFLNDLRNLHDEVSVAMYGPNFTQDQRIRAKAINFGIPYGRTAFTIAEEFDIPVAEAQRLIDAWFARAPQAAEFLRRMRSAPVRGETLITVFGRKRRPGVVSQERIDGLMNEFANFHMQSPVSDFVLHSGIRMTPRLKREGAHLVNLIHDSTLTEYPDDSKDREQQVAGIMKEVMEHVPTEWITTPIQFKVDMKNGTHWGLLKKYELH